MPTPFTSVTLEFPAADDKKAIKFAKKMLKLLEAADK